MATELYLRKFEYERSDGQTDRLTNRSHKHFLTVYESVKKHKKYFHISIINKEPVKNK